MADPAAFIATWFTPSSLFIFVNLVIGTIAITSRFSGAPKKQIHEPQPVRSPSLLDRVRSFNLRHYNHHEPTFVEQPESECTKPQLVRTPSLLERVSSFDLAAFYKHHQPTQAETHCAQPESECTRHQLVRTPSLLERVKSFSLTPHAAETEYVQPEPDNQYPNPDEPQLVRTPSLLERVRSMSFSRLYRSDSLRREQEVPDPKPSPGFDSGNEEMKKSASEKAVSMMCESEGEDEETVERRRPATSSASCREDEEVDMKADDFINRFKKQLRLQRLDSLLRYRDTYTIRGN